MMQGPLVRIEVDDDLAKLPPGFRFHPTDEEIIVCYLTEKVFNAAFTAVSIGEADLNKCEPWDLPKKAWMGEKERYFFCHRDRKYPTGVRTNRATMSGYWKATGKDKEIFQGKDCLVGMKKTLVFYKGRAPKGEKMNWVMHEYRLAEGRLSSKFSNSAKDEWVVCKILNKNTGMKKDYDQTQGSRRANSYEDVHTQTMDYSSLTNPRMFTTSQTVGSLPERTPEGFYFDYFPGLPCEYFPIKPEQIPLSTSDPFIGSNNHYYSFSFGQPEKLLPLTMVGHSEETTEASAVISDEGYLDDGLWDYDY